ncbi:hypothetical protein FGB62_34g143 [Gracilaria domingensis]|nr:hypothetical protein FGB62_34g143 [Gracilaria domingensis]
MKPVEQQAKKISQVHRRHHHRASDSDPKAAAASDKSDSCTLAVAVVRPADRFLADSRGTRAAAEADTERNPAGRRDSHQARAGAVAVGRKHPASKASRAAVAAARYQPASRVFRLGRKIVRLAFHRETVGAGVRGRPGRVDGTYGHGGVVSEDGEGVASTEKGGRRVASTALGTTMGAEWPFAHFIRRTMWGCGGGTSGWSLSERGAVMSIAHVSRWAICASCPHRTPVLQFWMIVRLVRVASGGLWLFHWSWPVWPPKYARICGELIPKSDILKEARNQRTTKLGVWNERGRRAGDGVSLVELRMQFVLLWPNGGSS